MVRAMSPGGPRAALTVGLRSTLRHSGFAHAVIDALALSQEGRIVARRAGAEAAEREGRV